MRWTRAVVAAVVISSAVAGCSAGSGSGKHLPAPATASGPAPSPTHSAADAKADLLAAADVMDQSGIADIALSDGMQGGGRLSWKSPQIAEIYAEPGGHRQMVRTTLDAMYLRLEDTTGENWIKLDEKTAKALDAQTGTDHLAMTSIFVALANPVQDLRAAAADNKVTVIGSERVDENSTTRYRAQITLDSLIAQMATLSDDAKTAVRARLAAYAPALTVEFWINDRGQLQQLGISAPASSPGKATVIGYMRSTHPAPTIPATVTAPGAANSA